MTISGTSDYLGIFKLLEKVQLDNKKIYFFEAKSSARNIRGSSYTAPYYLLTADRAAHDKRGQSNNTSIVEIPLNIDQSEILNKTFKIEDTELNDYLVSECMAGEPIIQVATKNKDIFAIKNFKINESIQGKVLNLDTQGEITEKLYKENYAFGSEYGHVSLIFSVHIPNYYFNIKEFDFNMQNLGILADHEIYEKFCKLSKYSNHLLSRNAPLFKTMTLKILNEILYKKGLIERIDLDNIIYFQDFNERESFYPYHSLNELEITRYPDFKKENYEIISDLKYEEFFKKNFSDPLNRFSYNMMIAKLNDQIIHVNSFETLDFGRSKEDNERKLILAKRMVPSIEFLTLSIPNKPITLEEIQEINADLYGNILSFYKAKWEKVIKKYRSLYKPKPVDENFLALKFIQKYFIINSSHANEYKHFTKSFFPIIDYFNETYGSFDDFFGTNQISKFFDILFNVSDTPYIFSNGRLEKETLSLKAIKERKEYYYSKAEMFYPSYSDASFISSVAYKEAKCSKYDNYIIINDSGTTQAWKNKTRIFASRLKKNGANLVTIIGTTDKFELMMLKKLKKLASHVILYSDFEGSIDIKPTSKKREFLPETVSIYTGTGIINTKSGESFAKKMDSFNMESSLFVEFHVTKKEFIFRGSPYPIRDLSTEFLIPMLEKYPKKKIYFLSKSELKKIKQFYGEETILLENYIETEEFQNEMAKIYDDYFVYSKSELLNMSKFEEILAYEFIGPTLEYNQTIKDFLPNKNFCWDYTNMLIQSLPEEVISIIYDILLKVPEYFLKRINSDTFKADSYAVRTAVRSTFMHEPEGSIGKIIYSKIKAPYDIKERTRILSKFEKSYLGIKSKNIIHRHSQNFFKLDILFERIMDLLYTSNMKNLNNEEVNELLNNLIRGELSTMNIKFQLLEEAYQKE